MNAATGVAAVTSQGVMIIMATDNITFPQLVGVLVFCIAIVVGCMLANAIFRRY